VSQNQRLRVFSTCPASNLVEGNYRNAVEEAARWSERAGCEGILVYADNALLDPWLVSQLILECTETLSPLVAVQPVYMHPYSVAKMVTTLSALYGRRLCLNMVAGGFRNDLLALADATHHDRRYDRLVEHATVIMSLLRGQTVTFEGDFYRVKNLQLVPPLSADLLPDLTVSGSSESGLAAARRLGAVAVEYPRRVTAYEPRPTADPDNDRRGIRIGIIARGSADEAWRVAEARFPEDRKGQIKHELAMKVSDSEWHQQLSRQDTTGSAVDPYWLRPFQHYKTFCPYLVGDYKTVTAEVSRYVRAGHWTIILDVPESAEELEHIGVVLRGVASAAGT